MPLRGHDENNGNFFQLITTLRATDIPLLKQFLMRKKNFLSPVIQNEILELMAHSVLRKVLCSIRKAGKFSIIVDGTTDSSTHEQISIFLRSVERLEPVEYLLGLYETPMKTGQALADTILDCFVRCDISIKDLVSQCYDGAANMSAGIKGVQGIIKKEQPNALYIHCTAHSLNLSVQDTIKAIYLLREGLEFVNEIGVFVKGSTKRVAFFEQIQNESGDHSSLSVPRPLCAVRWTVRDGAIKTILRRYSKLLDFLKTLATYKTESAETATKAQGLHKMMSKWSTYISLEICGLIFERTEILSKILQQSTATISGIRESVSITLDYLQKKRNDQAFDDLWKQLEAKIHEYDLSEPVLSRSRNMPQRISHFLNSTESHKWSTPREMIKVVYFEALDTVCQEIKSRFCQKDFEIYNSLENLILEEPLKWTEDMTAAAEKRGIDTDRLSTEMTMLRTIITIDNMNGVLEKFKKLHPDTQSLFQTFKTLANLLLLIPASSATAERSVSMLKRVKTFLRTTLKSERLNHLCILHAYKEETDNLNINEIVHEFVKFNDYRISVFGNKLIHDNACFFMKIYYV